MTQLDYVRKVFSIKQMLKCVLLFTFPVFIGLSAYSQKVDSADYYYNKTISILTGFYGEEYIPLESEFYSEDNHKWVDTVRVNLIIETCKKALSFTSPESKKRTATLNFILGEIYYKKVANTKATHYFEKARKGFEELGLKWELARADYELGEAYLGRGLGERAVRHFDAAYAYYYEVRDSIELAYIEYNYGLLARRRQDVKESLVHFERCLEFGKQMNDTVFMIWGLFGISLDLIQQDKFDESVEHLIQARDLAYQTHNTTDLTSIFNTLGESYYHLGKYPLAIDYYQLGLDNADKINYRYEKCNAFIGMAEVKLAQKKFNEAEKYGLQGYRMALEFGDLDFQSYVTSVLSELYEATNSPEKALEYYKLHTAIDDSILNQKTIEELANADIKHKALLAEAEKEQAGKELALSRQLNINANYRIYALTISIIGVVILLVFIVIYYRYRISKRNLREEQAKRAYIEEKQKLAEEKKELRQNLEFKKKETMEMASLLSYKNEFARQMVDVIAEILGKRELDKITSSLVELKFQLIQHIKSTNNLDIVFENIEVLQQEFYEKVRAINSEVTRKELFLSSLIRLGIDAKEMAGILGVSENTVRTYRYRLKKKLRLEDEIDLNEYIQDL